MFLPEWLITAWTHSHPVQWSDWSSLQSVHDHTHSVACYSQYTVKNTRHSSNSSNSNDIAVAAAVADGASFSYTERLDADGTGSRMLPWHGTTAVYKAIIGGRCLILRATPTQTVPTAARGPTESEGVDSRERGYPQTTTSPADQVRRAAAWNPVRKKYNR